MKKINTILLLLCTAFVFTSCSKENSINIISNLTANTLTTVESFNFNQTSDINYSYTNDSSYYGKTIELESTTNYQSDTTSLNNVSVFEKTYENKNVVNNYNNYETYNDFKNQNAYFKKGDQWFNVELSDLYQLGMTSVDPVYLINEILQNDKYYLKSGDEIVSAEIEYDTLVSTITKETFYDITKQSFSEYMNIQYDYDVITTVIFDSNYQIESISFDLSDLEAKYIEYMTYVENKKEVTCDLSYEIIISDYNNVTLDFNEDYESIGESIEISNRDDVSSDYFEGQDIIDTSGSYIIYDSDLSTFDCGTYIKPTVDLKYLHLEVLYFSTDDIYAINEYEFYNVKAGESLVLDKYTDSLSRVTSSVLNIYCLENEWTNFKNIKTAVDFDYTGPYTNLVLNEDNFKDVCNEAVDALYITKMDDVYNLDFSMLFYDTVQDFDYTLYLVDENGNFKLYYENQLDFEADDVLKLHTEITDVPVEAYLYLEYNSSLTVRESKKIKININKVTSAIDFLKFDSHTMRAMLLYTRDYEKKFDDYLYDYDIETDTFISNYIAMIYFVNYYGQVVDIDMVFVNNLNEYEDHKVVYDDSVKRVYTSINYKQGNNIKTAVINIEGVVNPDDSK